MTQHRHTIPKGANQTASVTDPDLTPYVKAADLAALALRVTALEHPAPPVVLPPMSRPWPLPVTTQTVNVPASIDATGKTDVAAALSAWISSGVPNGSIVNFPTGGTFLLSTGVQLDNKGNIIFRGNGARLHCTADGSTNPHSVIYLHWGNSHLTFDGFDLRGANLTPGFPSATADAAAAVHVQEGSFIEVTNCTGGGIHGDAIRVTGAADSVWFHDNVLDDVGNNLVGLVYATNVISERNKVGGVGNGVFDCEPNTSSQIIGNAKFLNNTAGILNGRWGFFFGACGAVGSIVHDITVDGNRLSGSPLTSIVNVARRQAIVFTNNASPIAAAGPVVVFAHIDGLTITGNVQPLISGSLASITDCTGVVGP